MTDEAAPQSHVLPNFKEAAKIADGIPLKPREMWSLKQIAANLGFTESGVKKWRGATIAALRDRRPLPRSALPVPDNQVDIDAYGVPPRWYRETVEQWAERTQRRDPVTKEKRLPTSPGRRPGSGKGARAGRKPGT